MSLYQLGDLVRIAVEFKDMNSAYIDPDKIYCEVRKPDGSTEQYEIIKTQTVVKYINALSVETTTYKVFGIPAWVYVTPAGGPVPANPTATVEVTQALYSGDTANIMRTAIGRFYIEIDAEQSGQWVVRFYSLGAGQAAVQDDFVVDVDGVQYS